MQRGQEHECHRLRGRLRVGQIVEFAVAEVESSVAVDEQETQEGLPVGMHAGIRHPVDEGGQEGHSAAAVALRRLDDRNAVIAQGLPEDPLSVISWSRKLLFSELGTL